MKKLMNITLTLLAGAFLILSSTLFAHTGLKSSWPANEQVLTEAPQQLSLAFQGKVRLAKVAILDSTEEALDINFKPVMQPQKDFKLALPALEAGQYHVNWMAMGGDGHKMKGHFQFTVTDEESVDAEDESETESHNHDDGHGHQGGHSINKPANLPVITVYKNPTCGCCSAWVSHLEKNGFPVKAHDVDNMLEYKQQAKLGAGMGSCHTAFVGGYAIEGHVPAKDLVRLLLEKPDISGLTVPRMPIGSPGMEVPGQPAEAFQVISYKDGEEVAVFSDYPAGSVFE